MRIESEQSGNNHELSVTLHEEWPLTGHVRMIAPFVLVPYARLANLRTNAPVRAENFHPVYTSQPVAFLVATETITISERI